MNCTGQDSSRWERLSRGSMRVGRTELEGTRRIGMGLRTGLGDK